MARKPLEKSAFYPYHVCNRSIDKTFYPVESEIMWNYCCDLLCILTWTYGVKIHAFVMMSNHYHLLTSTPEANLTDAMRYFQTELSKWIKKETSKGIFRFEGRYKYSIIKSASYYSNVYKYVYQNPVRAGLSKKVEDYSWSTIRGKIGQSKLKCPIAIHEYDGVIPEIETSQTDWLNFRLDDTELTRIRRGLRKSIYTPPKKISQSVGVQP